MMKFKLSVLGPVRIERIDKKRSVRLGIKIKALLAFLAFQPDRCADRDRVAGLLWDESSEADARHSLRQALMMLRARLGKNADSILRSDYDSIELCLDALEVDLRRFEQAAGSPDEALLIDTCSLWRGSFCEGLNVGSEAFEEWLLAQRIRLDELAAASFRRLAEMQLSAGRFGSAVNAAHQCVALNPYDDWSHAALIGLYRRVGWVGRARAAHRRCVALFQKELGVQPSRIVEEAISGPLG